MTDRVLDRRLHMHQYEPAKARADIRERRLEKSPFYSGAMDKLSDAECDALLADVFRYFDIDDSDTVPPPPSGLPGTGGAVREITMEALRIGAGYIRAIAERQPRRQWNCAKEMQSLLNERWRAGYNQARVEYDTAMMDRYAEQAANYVANQKATDDATLVYFIASELGQVKIGKAKQPLQRMRTLQTSHPAKLALLATCEGGNAKEREYHKRFAAARLHGEWFKRVPEIEAEIARLQPTPDYKVAASLRFLNKTRRTGDGRE